MMNVGNISTSPLSSVFGSPPPSPKGIPRTEMMVPRHTLERGEASGGNHDDSSSEEGEGYGMEYANRGLMLQVEDLFRFRHFRAKEIIKCMYTQTPVHMGEICKRILRRQSCEDSENIFIGPFVSRLAEALGFEEILSQEVITTTMRPIDMEEYLRTENGFYKLKHLQIVESDLKHWTVIVDHFPVLECLILSCCENLEEFPSAFVDITTLQLIKLTRCCSSIVTSAKQIQEERLGLGDNKFVVRDFRTVFGRRFDFCKPFWSTLTRTTSTRRLKETVGDRDERELMEFNSNSSYEKIHPANQLPKTTRLHATPPQTVGASPPSEINATRLDSSLEWRKEMGTSY
nr:putative late blight resistance protein homolog R1C-3 isoform X3 [Ipomoea batatas]